MTLAQAWKRKAKHQRRSIKRLYQRESEWLNALRLAGIGKMGDMNPDAIRLTITVPSEKRINEMVEERIASRSPSDARLDALDHHANWCSCENNNTNVELSTSDPVGVTDNPSPAHDGGLREAIEALPRLRITGEQLDAIDPDPEKVFYTDWDEWDEYVRLDAVRAALRSPAPDTGLREAVNGAYRERNALVAALIRVGGYRTWVISAPDADGWHIVYVETPMGQMSWHVHPTDIRLFADVDGAPLFSSRRDDDEWDGHTTDEKYERLAALASPPAPAGLDVERLARAMHSVHGGGPCYTRFRNCETGAEAIAREYAALAAEPK